MPTATAIPGPEGWSVFNPTAVEITVNGDFKITADVYTAKESDPSRPPGGDGSVQLSGLMVRDGSGGLENYVFIVVGDDGNGLSVETKNTVDGFSRYDGPSWGLAEAALRICRFGSTFNLYKRAVGSGHAWELADSFDRPDLPGTLQAGVNIYTDSTPDLQARFENLIIEPVFAREDCTN
jgi:hypothetical protein